jgi:uncharacterized Fe-S cluster-containing radical SAM superfamily protein
LYDPVARHEAIEKLVVRGEERKYWRFRPGRWYGGIITADAVGCGLVCKYCWVPDTIMFQPAHVGKFYSSETVAKILVDMASKRNLKQLRVSGGEPTVGREHLLQLLDSLEGQPYLFILETNGILIGNDRKYSKELAKYSSLHVRVSLKGCNEKEFVMLTGAKPEGFALQIKALENLLEAGVSCHPAAIASFSRKESLKELTERLRGIGPKLAEDLEIEELILYPSVKRRMEKYNLKYCSAYTSEGILKG